MASASPPPPPDPTKPHGFPSCGPSSSSPSRPPLRRAKTLANPESPTRWRRDPLVDVTNHVLARDHPARLQRVPVDPDLLPSPSPANAPQLPSPPPSTPSRIPRRGLRRTQSAMPSLDSSPTSLQAAPSALPFDGLASPTRELRPRVPRPAGSTPAGTSASRRSSSGSFGTTLGGGGGSRSSSSSNLARSAPSTPTAGPSRRRTFGGIGLAPVLEDPPSDSDAAAAAGSSAAPTPTPTPRTRSRARGIDEGEDAPPSENERRLRRRRTVGGSPSSSGLGGDGQASSSLGRSPSLRRGLR
ncbi:hypothetical protein JCM10207_003080 [Rhodosporidiobolus poonsookiae]